MRARTMERENGKKIKRVAFELGSYTLNHSFKKKSLLKAVRNSKEEHTNTQESEREFHF